VKEDVQERDSSVQGATHCGRAATYGLFIQPHQQQLEMQMVNNEPEKRDHCN